MLSGTVVQPGGNLHAYNSTNGQYCNTTKSTFFAANQANSEVQAGMPSSSGKIKVYPNPTAGKFTLETDDTCTFLGAAMEIYGGRGDKIMSMILPGERKHEFSLSDHPSWLYFIRVITGSFAETAKIIKQ